MMGEKGEKEMDGKKKQKLTKRANAHVSYMQYQNSVSFWIIFS
jgi:hypothetical protein